MANFLREDATFTTVDYSDISGSAPSQTTIADKRILSNISGSTAPASGNSLTSLLDNIIGSTRGTILYRGSSAWSSLSPGSSGQFLQTNGTSGDPQWATVSVPTQYVLAFGSFGVTSATVFFTASNSLNISAVSRNSTGDFSVTFGTSLPSTNYYMSADGQSGDGSGVSCVGVSYSKSTSVMKFQALKTSGAFLVDPFQIDLLILGK